MIESEDINFLQKKVLIRAILCMANDELFWKLPTKGHAGHAHYDFNNMIAGYSLYNEEYSLTEGAKKIFDNKKMDVNTTVAWIRSNVYKIRDENGHKQFIFEHLVPNSIKVKLIKAVVELKGEISESEMKKILDYGCITIMTQEENRRITRNKLSKALPDGCDTEVNPELRYVICGITLSDVKLKMSGVVAR